MSRDKNDGNDQIACFRTFTGGFGGCRHVWIIRQLEICQNRTKYFYANINFGKSRVMLLLPALFSLFDDEFLPACVVSSARVFGALYLTSLLPLTSLHWIFWNVRYFPYHSAGICSRGWNRIRMYRSAIARFDSVFRRSLAPVFRQVWSPSFQPMPSG